MGGLRKQYVDEPRQSSAGLIIRQKEPPISICEPPISAKAAALAAEVTGGRLILGLGVSHQPVNEALGIDMPDPAAALRKYAVEVASWLRGDGPTTHLPQQPAPYPVPIYLAALTSQNVELASEIADGVMPIWWSVERLARTHSDADQLYRAEPHAVPSRDGRRVVFA